MRPPARSNRTANYTKASPLLQLAKVVKKATKKTGKGLTKTQKTAVQRIVKGAAETKYCSEALMGNGSSSVLSTWTNFSTAITGVAEMYGCLPRVSQGVDECNRVGNTISPTSCKVKLDMCIGSHGDNDSYDLTIHIFFLTCPQVKAWNNYTAIPITTLLAKGDGTNVSFDGTQFVAQYPVNNAEFRVIKHRQFRLVKGFGQALSTTSVTAGGTDAVISPSNQYVHITQKIPLPKKFKYENNSSTYPTNYAPFMCIGYTRNDANTGAVSNHFIRVLGQTQMSYKDE